VYFLWACFFLFLKIPFDEIATVTLTTNNGARCCFAKPCTTVTVTGSESTGAKFLINGLVDAENFCDLVNVMIEKAKAATSLDIASAEIIGSDEENGVKTADSV
jgi:hypothetical protein